MIIFNGLFLYFDLKLRSKNLGRSYVIKDIPYFLRALKNYSQYSLGSLHYIDLFLIILMKQVKNF